MLLERLALGTGGRAGLAAIQIVGGADRANTFGGGDLDWDVILGDAGAATMFGGRTIEILSTDTASVAADVDRDWLRSGDDGDLLIDCKDPDCFGAPECQIMVQDPAVIRFGPPGEGRDQLRAHGLIQPLSPIDPRSEEVFIMLTDSTGIVYRGSLIAGDLLANRSGSR